jgi:cysteine synthase A
VYVDQFDREANWQMHYRTTGPEIYAVLPEVTAFVTASGTGGTLAGTARYLKEQNPRIQAGLANCQVVG